MIYMKEMRAKVIAESTLKESAAINQILGKRVRPIDLHIIKPSFIHFPFWSYHLHTLYFSHSPQWHQLSRAEQETYYDKAKKERYVIRWLSNAERTIRVRFRCFPAPIRSCLYNFEFHSLTDILYYHRELHMELHPGWTAKDNYAINAKRKKKKRERNADGGMCISY